MGDFRLFIEVSTFRVVHEDDPMYRQHGGSGYVRAYLGLKQVGLLHWHAERANGQGQLAAHISSVSTEPEFRGHGVAKRLEQELVNYLRKSRRDISYITGEVMSGKMLSVRNSIFGKPDYMGTYSDDITNDMDRAKEELPPDADVDSHGMMSGPSVYVRNKIPSRIAKSNLRKFKPFITQPELPFR